MESGLRFGCSLCDDAELAAIVPLKAVQVGKRTLMCINMLGQAIGPDIPLPATTLPNFSLSFVLGSTGIRPLVSESVGK